MATDVAVLKHGVVGEEKHANASACCKTGPGYATPLEAMSGPREALIYVTCVYTGTPSFIFLYFN
jgi:selenium-binding protein 1